ncbi:Hypothetical protein I595_1522 [Croceitalea dokdonensis DOKDO 023]|uniref:Uncharacterized protein n=1 Tax=Croceitalea dokdonensis DOKDO 023 TaxID=1300341 RepID=A0A0P7AYB3_9FLAO|nr:Hypothetical protein I595_1522 [Croceitalea dokdonensis DOKDO 023]
MEIKGIERLKHVYIALFSLKHFFYPLKKVESTITGKSFLHELLPIIVGLAFSMLRDTKKHNPISSFN